MERLAGMTATSLNFEESVKIKRAVEDFQHLVEGRRARRLQSLANWWSFSISELVFLLRSSIRLANIRRRIRRTYSFAKVQLRHGELSREDILKAAEFYADVANRFFKLAENDRRMIDRMRMLEFKHTRPLAIIAWTSSVMERYHDDLGCLAEDIAETLALGASESFCRLVHRELNELS